MLRAMPKAGSLRKWLTVRLARHNRSALSEAVSAAAGAAMERDAAARIAVLRVNVAGMMVSFHQCSHNAKTREKFRLPSAPEGAGQDQPGDKTQQAGDQGELDDQADDFQHHEDKDGQYQGGKD